MYRSDGLRVYREWLPAGRHVVGKGGAVNWNEGLHSERRTRLNRLGAPDEGLHEESGSARVLAGVGTGVLDGKT